MESQTLSQGMARFITKLEIENVPRAVEEKLKACLINGIGIALASTEQREVKTARAAVLAIDGERPEGATLLVDGRKTSACGAAVANCVMFYGSGGQCDTMGSVHVGMTAIPLTLAMAEAGYPAARILPALLSAYEVAGLLDGPFGRYSAERGFRGTPLYGAIGVAAAAGTMMALDETRMASALSIAASFTGGLLQPYDDASGEPRHQPGSAIRNGLAAAELARAGVQGAPRAFEGRSGLIPSFARQTCDVAELLGRLGREWSVDRVFFKPYAVCAFNQTPVMATVELSRKLAVKDIESITVRMNSYETSYAGMDSKGPFKTQTAHTMSIPYCVALTLVRGAPFTTRPLNIFDDEDVYALVRKVDLVTDDDIPNLSARIEVMRKDGSTMVQRQNMTAADYAFPRPRVEEMVRRIGADNAVPTEAFDRVNQFVDSLPNGSLRTITDAFAMLKATAPTA